MARYQDVLDRADTHFRRVLDEQPGAMQCRLGCTLCCQGLFEISAADLVVLMEGLRQLDREALVDLVRKSLGSIERLDHPDLSNLDEAGKREFFDGPAAVEPCPALSSEGACTIYSHRPLLCRTFGLPVREGEEYRGEECELNFTASSRADKERAAWDLEWEDAVDSQELRTIPQAIVLIASILKREAAEDEIGPSIAEVGATED